MYAPSIVIFFSIWHSHSLKVKVIHKYTANISITIQFTRKEKVKSYLRFQFACLYFSSANNHYAITARASKMKAFYHETQNKSANLRHFKTIRSICNLFRSFPSLKRISRAHFPRLTRLWPLSCSCLNNLAITFVPNIVQYTNYWHRQPS